MRCHSNECFDAVAAASAAGRQSQTSDFRRPSAIRHGRTSSAHAAASGTGSRLSSRVKRSTRTPKKDECPSQRPRHSSVEVLTAYSHSTQAAGLWLCHTAALTGPLCAPRPRMKRPVSLRDRLDERDITDLITVYRNSAAPSLTAALGLNLKSIKRLLHIAGGSGLCRRPLGQRQRTFLVPVVRRPVSWLVSWRKYGRPASRSRYARRWCRRCPVVRRGSSRAPARLPRVRAR